MAQKWLCIITVQSPITNAMVTYSGGVTFASDATADERFMQTRAYAEDAAQIPRKSSVIIFYHCERDN